MPSPPPTPQLHWLAVGGLVAVLALALSVESPPISTPAKVSGADRVTAPAPSWLRPGPTPGRRPAPDSCTLARNLCCPTYCGCRGKRAKDACGQAFRACARRSGCRKPAAAVCRCKKR